MAKELNGYLRKMFKKKIIILQQVRDRYQINDIIVLFLSNNIKIQFLNKYYYNDRNEK